MKLVGSGQVRAEGQHSLDIDQSLADALGLRENALLYAVALTSDGAKPPTYQKDPSGHWVTIVASPFPTSSWGHLLRASVTVDPKPGALSEVFAALEEIEIYCRQAHSSNGIDLGQMAPYIPGRPLRDPSTVPTDSPNLIIPSTLLILELPLNPRSVNNVELHEALRDLIDLGSADTETYTAAREKLQGSLKERLEQLHIEVNWVSPMITLNRLSRASTWSLGGGSQLSAADVPAVGQKLTQQGMETTLVAPSESLQHLRKKVVLGRNLNGSLSFDLNPWRELVWPVARKIPDPKTSVPRVQIYALSHIDIPENVLIFDLFSSEDHFILEFELLHPAAGREDEWWRWLFERIAAGGGNILTTTVPARLDGYWGTIRLKVVFQLHPNSQKKRDGTVSCGAKCSSAEQGKRRYNPFPEGDIGRILCCLKELQCEEGGTTAYKAFKKRLKSEERESFPRLAGRHMKEIQEGKREPELRRRDESTLRDVRILDPNFKRHPERPYYHQFAENPFFFTHPLDLNSYRKLYEAREDKEGGQEKRTRYRLASRITDRLAQDPGENIAVVGAHRAGKTTVLNLVYDLVKKDLLSESPENLHPSDRRVVEVDYDQSSRHWRVTFAGQVKSPQHSTKKEAQQYALELARARPPALVKVYKMNGELDRTDASSLPLILPVRINASVTPPVGLFAEIITQIEAFANKGLLKKGLSSLKRNIESARQELITLASAQISVAGIGSIELSRQKEDWERVPELIKGLNPSQGLRAVSWAYGSFSRLQGSQFLKDSLEILKRTLDAALREGQGDREVKIVVIVDEVPLLSGWGEEDATFPVWRWVIESKDFARLRWLISTSRMVDFKKHYSPITNVFREYNVGSLRVEESEALLDAFSPPGTNQDPGEPLYPILTFPARELLAEITSRLPYLLQVACYHLYDRATRVHLPIINEVMCQYLVVHEVLEEVSDYLESQWRQVPEESRELVMEILSQLPTDPEGFFQVYERKLKNSGALPAQCRKALRRSGLQGDDEFIVAPLVALWLLENIYGEAETSPQS